MSAKQKRDIQKLYEQNFLTEKQAEKLHPTFALTVGRWNKENNKKPKTSMSKTAWANDPRAAKKREQQREYNRKRKEKKENSS